MKQGWILAAVFDSVGEENNLLAVEKTETLNFGESGVEVKVQIKMKDMKKYQTALLWKSEEG